jgi:hypothetical protein
MNMRTIAVLVCAAGAIASASPTALAPFTAGKLTVSLPKGWKVTADLDKGVIAAQQDPAHKDAAAALVVIQPSTTSTEDQLLDLVASSISKDLKVAKREARTGGGHVMIADGTTDGIKVRLGVIAIASGGSAIVCVVVAKPGEFDKLGGIELVSGILTSIKTSATAQTSAPTQTAPAQTAPAPATVNGKLVVPPLTHKLSISELGGEWRHDDGIIQNYVDRVTGTYAGFDALHYTDKWTFDGKGGMFSEFFGIVTSGGVSKKLVENKGGDVSLDSNMVMTIKWKTGPQQEYLVRGLVELPTMTVITFNGPWYDKGVAADVLADPTHGTNLDQHWVRKK